MPLPEFLKWLIASKYLSKIGDEGIKKVYSIIRKIHSEGKFAFFPNKEEAYTLKKLAARSWYREFKRILPGHWGVDVVRTACYIMILEEKGDNNRVKEIKESVFRNRKILGLRLIEMVQNGVFVAVLDRLTTLKDEHKYSHEDLENDFENVLADWQRITIFVQNADSKEKIKTQAMQFIDASESTFFILAKGNAIATAQSVLVELQKEDYILEKGYVWFAKTSNDTKPPTYYCGVYSSTYLL